MKLTLEKYKTKYIVETENDDLGVDEQIDIFIGLLYQAGYYQDGIKETIIELAESYKEEFNDRSKQL